MVSSRYGYGVAIGMILFALQVGAITWSERALMPPSEWSTYALTRAFLALSALFFGRWIARDYRSLWPNLGIAVTFWLYSLHGQWHRPLYYFAVLQLSVAVAFFLALPKQVFRVLMALWLSSFLLVLRFKWEQYRIQIQEPVYSDLFFAIVSTGILLYITHTYFTLERLWREKALARFSRLGFQSARLVHDLKGLTSAPKIYAQILQSRLKDSRDPVVAEAVEALAFDIENLQRVVMEINEMAAMRAEDEVTEFGLSEITASIRSILGNRLKNIKLADSVPLRLRTDRSLVTSIFLNLILNSLENFRQRRTSAPEIRLEAEGSRIVFTDNGGGFDEALLQRLAQGKFSSTKPNGTGMGLWIVLDGMANLGGKATFANSERGVLITLTFPKSAILN